ncbi:MAG: hypothetical protein UZ07_CHB004002731, partial [Chlorobi bacterium OLB7]
MESPLFFLMVESFFPLWKGEGMRNLSGIQADIIKKVAAPTSVGIDKRSLAFGVQAALAPCVAPPSWAG